MRKSILLAAFLMPITLIAQTKVAVYVTGTENTDDAIKHIIGSELVAGITQHSDYVAVERTPDFVAELRKEQGTLSTNADDKHLSNLGKRFGVDEICIANLMPYQNAYYIQARMLNVSNANILTTAREISELSSIDQIVSTIETISAKLIGPSTKQYNQEFSTVLVSSNKDCDIISIDNTGNVAIVEFKLITPTSTQILISPETYILDKETNKRYKMLGCTNISSTQPQTINAGITPFSVTFEKLPQSIRSIDIVEPDGWYWKDVTLIPYNQPNYYQFADNTSNKYDDIMREIKAEAIQKEQQQQALQRAEEQRQQQAERSQALLQESLGVLGNSIQRYTQTINSYVIEVHNSSKHPYKVAIDGHVLGSVNAYKIEKYLVPLEWYGKLQAVQTSGYLFTPTVYNYQVPPQQKKANIKIRIQ
ncbi:MAG: hypothetical protein ACI30A_05975 [Paludibacteraceae bacterium]